MREQQTRAAGSERRTPNAEPRAASIRSAPHPIDAAVRLDRCSLLVMPTPAEQNALLFLAGVALVGGGVRLIRREELPLPTLAERAALGAQIEAADSAAVAGREAKGKGKRKPRGPRGGAAQPTGGPAPLAERASPDRRPPTADLVIDIDRASVIELDRLPGVGPALAQRIADDRATNGAFGSLAALDGVSGIGPALLRRLEPHVTFSGPPRPLSAVSRGDRGLGARPSGRVVGLIGGRP